MEGDERVRGGEVMGVTDGCGDSVETELQIDTCNCVANGKVHAKTFKKVSSLLLHSVGSFGTPGFLLRGQRTLRDSGHGD